MKSDPANTLKQSSRTRSSILPRACLRRYFPAILLTISLSPFPLTLGCHSAKGLLGAANAAQGTVTDIAIGSTARLTSVKRLGVNLSVQDFYDSGQMLRNLVSRNPGFEGATWQSIIRCKRVTVTSCTDGNQYDTWPADFIKGASFEFITGPSKGIHGTVLSSTKSAATNPNLGITLNFANPGRNPTAGDFVLVRIDKPGDPIAGWWADPAKNGATFSTETSDLSPKTPGKQALRITAAGPGQTATLHSYFDTYGHDRSFVQLRGPYNLTFRAKSVGGGNTFSVSVSRLATSIGNETLLGARPISLTQQWKDYSLSFNASENGKMIGPVDLAFSVSGANILLDDVALEAPPSKNNNTAFRDEVVETLRTLHPGVLRSMDSGTSFGSSIDNMLASAFARKRTGSSLLSTTQEDIPMGLHDFLQLCQVLGTEPWYSMPAGTSPQEAKNLIEYLAGSPTTPYGAKRAASGQSAPWTSVFPIIHLELGNEQWNGLSFYGASIYDAAAFGQRASDVYAAARSSTSYNPAKFDLILGSWAVVPWWTKEQLSNSAHYDSVAVAPYLFNEFNDASSNEAIFGPMFAEPEMIDSLPSGFMAQQLKAAREGSPPAKLAIYEVNLSTTQGSVPQAALDSVIPSLGAGLALADHMLLMMRDLGVTTQAVFGLSQYSNGFKNPNSPGSSLSIPLWGIVVDMGGNTNLRRPQFLAEQLANEAILPNMVGTTLTGANPTWRQNLSTNDKVSLDHAHLLQTFAFADGIHHSLIVFNLSRDRALPITFSGPNAPAGSVAFSQLTAAKITDTNELKENVTITKKSLDNFQPKAPYSLPPFSMNVFKWDTSGNTRH
ncbi:MAG: hypothetical protein ABI197_06815 [Granulicella sp.]